MEWNLKKERSAYLRNNQLIKPLLKNMNTIIQTKKEERKAYLIGGGIASLSAAVFLLRDGKFLGKNIFIYDESRAEGNKIGGSLDGSGSDIDGFVIRGGRMLNYETFECMWDLLKSVPSIENKNKSVYEEIVDFNKTFRTNSKARLINKKREKIDVSKLGLSNRDRIDLLKLKYKSEDSIGNLKIEDYFSSPFFRTNFWMMWSTMFAFHSKHSLVEFKRYTARFFHELYRIHTLSGVRRTRYNQYESLVLPMVKWIKKRGVVFEHGAIVTNLDLKTLNNKHKVVSIEYNKKGQKIKQVLQANDLVFMTNGSMTDGSTLGSTSKPPVIEKVIIGNSWKLWEKISKGKKDFGNPKAFCKDIDKTKWESFTVTLEDPKLINLIIEFSGNRPGTGGLVTFKDSNWLLSIVVPAQPHFKNQKKDINVFWGYGFFPEKKGNFINKKMSECSGSEILQELCSHFKFDKDISSILKTSKCIPCMMPYITSQFMPRHKIDRPQVVPNSSTNLAFIGQYCEIPKDVVFTIEYAVRSAQIAVYSFLKINKKIPGIYNGERNPMILIKSLRTLFK